MTPYLLLLGLSLSPPSRANDPFDRLLSKPIVQEMKAVIAEGDAQPASCDTLHRMVTLTKNFAPPASCRTSAAFYDSVIKMAEDYADGCEEFRREVDSQLGGALACEEGSPLREIQRDRLITIKRSWSDAGEQLEKQKFITFEEPWIENSKLGKGEFAREECVLPVVISFQLRKQLSTVANQNAAQWDNAVYEACEEPEPMPFILRPGG